MEVVQGRVDWEINIQSRFELNRELIGIVTVTVLTDVFTEVIRIVFKSSH